VTQLQIWQDHRFFIVQQSELWVWVSEKFQFSIFLPCKRSRNFAEKISGLYSVLSRVFTDKKFFWERYRAAKHFFGWHVCLSSILVAQSEKRWTFRQCQGQTLEDLQVSLWAIFLRMTFRGIVENASSHFHFPFSSAAAKIALHFFRRIFWNDRDQKFYRGVCSGKVYLKNPIYDISRIRLTSYRSTQVLIDIEIQFSIVWYAQISTSHFVAESKLFHWTNFDVFEKTSSSFCVKRKRQPRYLFFFLFEEGGSVAGQSATIRFGRGRRPRGPTYARGT
jgi:hypothetical protein